jgi:hypothetical protein
LQILLKLPVGLPFTFVYSKTLQGIALAEDGHQSHADAVYLQNDDDSDDSDADDDSNTSSLPSRHSNTSAGSFNHADYAPARGTTISLLTEYFVLKHQY